MDEATKKRLANDTDGLTTYEYIANNIESIDDMINDLVDNMIRVDGSGQFTVSAARYLHAINATKYAPEIDRLISAAIDKDRERVYIGSLLADIWGNDYSQRIDSLRADDRNFRRIYQRLYPESII